jgi:putative ABC transport system permease protein
LLFTFGSIATFLVAGGLETGLCFVVVRAVRERRRSIGVRRTLGFQARWVKAACVGESSLVAEGITLGT